MFTYTELIGEIIEDTGVAGPYIAILKNTLCSKSLTLRRDLIA